MSEVANTGILAWEAFAEPKKPVCVSARADVGLSVSIYHSRRKGVKGIAVYRQDGSLVSYIGKVPKAAKRP